MLGVQHDLRFLTLALAGAEFKVGQMACQVRIQATASMAVLPTCGLLLFDKMAVFICFMPRTSMSFIRRTFGGLSAAYYIRHFLIGLIFYVFIIFDFGGSKENPNYWSIMMTFTACQLLYPYAYFVYDRIADYILGDRGSYFVSHIMSVVRIFAVILCWFGAPIIAPLGLAWLYWEHGRQEQ